MLKPQNQKKFGLLNLIYEKATICLHPVMEFRFRVVGVIANDEKKLPLLQGVNVGRRHWLGNAKGRRGYPDGDSCWYCIPGWSKKKILKERHLKKDKQDLKDKNYDRL